MKRHFSATTPQHAPTPRAAWQASASGRYTALAMAQSMNPGSRWKARATMSSVASVLFQSAKRFARMRARMPRVRAGAGRAAMGWKVAAMPQRSWIAARRLYQFMNAEVESDITRYTAMMMAMASTARPVWLSDVFAIDTTSG